MRFTISFIALVALAFTEVLGAPIMARQGAGVGAACNYIVSDADTMIGESSRGAGKTIAGSLRKRQGAGVGAGCDYIVSDADTMIGESSRGSGKTIAGMMGRQLNGMADGITAITAKVPGAEQPSSELDANLNTLDGYGTDGSAALGQEVGDAEVGIGNSVGGANGQSGGGATPPRRRQLNGMADGITAITAKVPGAADFSDDMDSFLNTVDGQGTDDSAEAGKMVGDEEVRIGDSVGGQNGQSGGGGTAPAPAAGPASAKGPGPH